MSQLDFIARLLRRQHDPVVRSPVVYEGLESRRLLSSGALATAQSLSGHVFDNNQPVEVVGAPPEHRDLWIAFDAAIDPPAEPGFLPTYLEVKLNDTLIYSETWTTYEDPYDPGFYYSDVAIQAPFGYSYTTSGSVRIDRPHTADEMELTFNGTGLGANQHWYLGNTGITWVLPGVRFEAPLVVDRYAREGPAGDPDAQAHLTLIRTDDLYQTRSLAVTLAVSGSASDADLVQPVPRTVIFQPGQWNKQIPMSAFDDTLGEGNESVIVTIVDEIGYGLYPDPAITSQTVTIGDNEPEVNIVVAQDGSEAPDEEDPEGGPKPIWFQVSRYNTNNFSQPLTIGLSKSGTASTQDYSGLPTSVTIPANAGSTTFSVTPIDDQTPEWTETLKATLTPNPSAGYSISPTAGFAEAEIVDDDLFITLEEDVLIVNNGAGDEFYPVQLEFPAEVKPGARITLTAPNDKVRIWGTADGSGTALIDATHGSHTWVVGQDSPDPTVFVEAIAGSVAIDDVVLTLQATDSTATPATRNSTTTQATTAKTNVKIAIIWNGQDVTSKQQATIVGNRISLDANVQNPVANNPTYQWTIPGEIATAYSVSLTNGEVFPALPLDYTFKTVGYYWLDGTLQGTDRVVSVSVNLPGIGPISRKTTFKVHRPDASITALTGDVVVHTTPEGPMMSFARSPASPPDDVAGIRFSQNVTMPQGFGGQTFWYQIGNVVAREKRFDGKWYQLDMPPTFGLDQSLPYPFGSAGPNAATDASDVPGTLLDSLKFSDAIRNDDFKMYLMFESNLPNSFPVPLRVVDWFWAGHAHYDGQNWNLVYGNSSQNPVDRDTTHSPEWDYYIQSKINADVWIPDP